MHVLWSLFTLTIGRINYWWCVLVDLSALDKEEFKLTTGCIVSEYTLQCLHHEKHFCRDFLSFLPPEIAFSILVYLDVKDLIRGLQVCRKWRQLITEATPAWKAAANKVNRADDGDSKGF